MVESLPDSLSRKAMLIAEAIRKLQASWPAQVVLSADTESSAYDCFPYLFRQAFPSIIDRDLDRFAIASRLFASSVFLHDKLFDQGTERDSYADLAPTNALRVVAMQFEAYRQLHELFPSGSCFWRDFRCYLGQFAIACVEEQKFVAGGRPWQEYSEELSLQIARGKNGVSRAAIAGLVALEGNRDALQPLTQAIDAYNVGRQMLDDLCDWKEDLAAGVPSLLLARVLGQKPTRLTEEEFSRLKEEVGREIFYGGHAKYLMELAIATLDEAYELIGRWPTLLWLKVHVDLRQQCALFLQDLEQIVEENLQRASSQQRFDLKLPAPLTPWQDLAWQALHYMIEQWHVGFGEARHVMEFPPEAGFSGPQYQRGDVFQRALFADILCDADHVLSGQLCSVIDGEIRYLLEQRARGRCGWSYFANLPELPADADDLAQIVQVLWRSGHQDEIQQYCAEPIAILLEDNRHADGSIETWILPGSGLTEAERRQAEFARTTWGTGPDPDVMANLLYALSLINQEQFQDQIQSGLTYLIKRQKADGSWNSTWYHGPFYGTYVCVRLLIRVSPECEAIRLAADFLARGQSADGNWGNPLDTCLALLGLACVQTTRFAASRYDDLAGRALAYLQASYKDGSWPRCEFIRMDTGRASRSQSPVLSYGSRTMTTALVLKAALSWHRLEQARSQHDLE